jgi:hypothetical protein
VTLRFVEAQLSMGEFTLPPSATCPRLRRLQPDTGAQARVEGGPGRVCAPRTEAAMFALELDLIEARILGVLIEKEPTTDQYPPR